MIWVGSGRVKSWSAQWLQPVFLQPIVRGLHCLRRESWWCCSYGGGGGELRADNGGKRKGSPLTSAASSVDRQWKMDISTAPRCAQVAARILQCANSIHLPFKERKRRLKKQKWNSGFIYALGDNRKDEKSGGGGTGSRRPVAVAAETDAGCRKNASAFPCDGRGGNLLYPRAQAAWAISSFRSKIMDKNTIIRSVSGTANINGAHFQTNLCVGVDGIMASRQKLLICATAAYSTAGALLVHRDGRAYLRRWAPQAQIKIVLNLDSWRVARRVNHCS